MLLDIGSESVEISDYQIRSSADGTTELLVTVKGTSEVFELSTSLKEQSIEYFLEEEKGGDVGGEKT